MRSETAVLRMGHGGRLASATLNPASYWKWAETAVIIMIAVVAVRVHEFFPVLRFVKPVFTFSILGFVLLWKNSAPGVRSGIARHGLSKLVYLYWAVVVLTIPFALWHSAAIETAESLLPAILLYAAFQLVPPNRQTLERLEFAFLVLVLFFAWFIQTKGFFRGGRLVSVSGTFDENDVASILALTLPMAVSVLMRVQGTKKRAAAGFAILTLVAVVMETGSRGGALALAAGLMIFVMGLNSAKALLVTYFMMIGAGAAWIFAPPVFKNRILSLTNLQNDYNVTSDTGRKAVWARGRLYIKEHPVLGVGAGNFFVAEGQYNDATGRTGKWSAAHNAYIQAFAELGFTGGIVFIAMLAAAVQMAIRMWRRPQRSRAPPLHRPELLAGLAAYCVGAVFLSHAYFNPAFVVLGLTVLAERVSEAERTGSVSAVGGGDVSPLPAMGERGGLARPATARDRSIARQRSWMHRGGLDLTG